MVERLKNRTMNDFPVTKWETFKKICKRKYPGTKLWVICRQVFDEWIERNK